MEAMGDDAREGQAADGGIIEAIAIKNPDFTGMMATIVDDG
jgi:hypothetical protein